MINHGHVVQRLLFRRMYLCAYGNSYNLEKFVNHQAWRLAVEHFIAKQTKFFPGCWTKFVRTVSLNQYINSNAYIV